MTIRTKLTIVVTLLLCGVGTANAQKRVPVDYSDPECEGERLCANEKNALLHARLAPSGYLAKYRQQVKTEVGVKINEIRSKAHKLIFKDFDRAILAGIDFELDLLKKMLAKETLNTKTLDDALSEFPDSKCIFSDARFNSEVIYRLCAEKKLSEKLSQMLKRLGEVPARSKVQALHDDISAQLSRFNIFLSDTSMLVESGEVVRASIESTPYLSMVGEPKVWLDLIYGSFSGFATSAAVYRREVAELSGLLKALSEKSSQKSVIQREKQSLEGKIAEIEKEVRRVQAIHDQRSKERQNTERELATSKERARRFIRNIPSYKNVKRAEKLSGIANYTAFTIVARELSESNDFPFDLGDAYADVTHIDIGVQYDIGVTFDGVTYQSLNGKYKPVKSQKGVPVRCGDKCLAPDLPRGILLVRFKCKVGDRTYIENIAVGTGALVDNPTYIPHLNTHCRKFGFALNEDQGLLNGLKKFAFSKTFLSIQFNSYVSAYAEFTRSTKEIASHGDAILKNVPYSPLPLVAGKNALEMHLKEMNISAETIRFLEPLLIEIVNQRLISNKLERMDYGLRDLSSQIDILKNRSKTLRELLKGIESTVEENAATEKIVNLAIAYSTQKLESTFGRLSRELGLLENWLYIYTKSVLYRYPENRDIEQKFSKISAVLRAFYLMPTPYHESYFGRTARGDEDHCKILSPLGSNIELLCKSFDKSKDADHVKDILKLFMIGEDQKWRIEQTVSQQLVKHCFIDFSNDRGKGYLETHHDGAKSIRDLFHEKKWLEKYYFPRTDKSRFSKVTACHLLGSSFVERCLHKSNREEDGDYLMDMVGYFEVPVSSIVNEPDMDDNMICSDGFTGNAPLERLLGVSIESASQKKDLPTKVPVFIEKSNRTWAYKYSDSGVKRYEAQVYNSGSVKVTTPGRLNIRSVNVFSKEHLTGPESGFACASNYASKKCITTQFGEVLNDATGGYRFRTSFLNSRIGNEWIVRIPVFSKNDQSRNQKELIDKMDNLIIHFYLNQVVPR